MKKKASIYKAGLILLMLAVSFSLSVLFVSKRGDASDPISPDECCRCHFNTCEQAESGRYTHTPAREKQCSVCHIQQTETSQAKKKKDDPKTIDWFTYSQTNNAEHWFEIPQEAQGALLFVQIQNENGSKVKEEITSPTLDEAQSFPALQGTTQVSDLKVTEVKRGVFISATVTWKTDRLTESKLLYGQGDLRSSTASDPNLATSHTMSIIGLEAGKSYQVAASGQDFFGKNATSEPITFSTTRFWSNAKEEASQNQEPTLDTEFFKIKEKLFIHLTVNQPVSSKLGYQPGQKATEDTADNSTALPTQHLPLTDPYQLNIDICVTCHPQSKGELSHPVDVLPERGMVIPKEYKTLADGRLTCMTCHEPHASNNPYRLTHSNRKDLCLGCHINF